MDLTELVSEEVVKIPLVSTTKSDILRELVEILDTRGGIDDRESVYQALLEREKLGSTGLEKGIAIPHCKTDAVTDITVAVGVSPDGVDFDSMDGELSRLFFLVLAGPDQSTSHIQVLSEIGRLTRSQSYVDTLMRAATPQEFMRRFCE